MTAKDGYVNGKPDIGWWVENISKSERWRKKYAQEAKWPSWRNYYRGLWAPGILPKNIYYKTLRTLIPRIYFRNPSIAVAPALPGLENAILAKLLERIDNKLFTRMRVKEQAKRIVQNAVMFGTGVGKLGYGAQFTPTPDMLGTEAPERGSIARRKAVEYNDLVIPNNPWFMSVHPGSFIVPVGSMDMHSSRWVGHKIIRSLADVQGDPRLKHTSLLKAGTSSIGARMNEEQIPDPVELIEIRDKMTQLVMVIAPTGESGKKLLLEEQDTMQEEGRLPFYPLIFNIDDEVFWGVPDSQIVEPMQLEANATRTSIMKHRRTSLIKWAVKMSTMTADELEKLTDENVRAVIQMSGDPNTDLKELNPGGIPAGLLEADRLNDQEFQETLGLGVNQFGEYAPGSADRSATEANIVKQATDIRIDERRDVTADMFVDVTTDMHRVIFQHWSDEQVIDIVGPAGIPIWIKFRPDMLKNGQYEVKIDPDSSLPETKAVREQKAVQAYSIFKQNPMINPQGLTQFLLNAFYGVQYDNLLLNMPQTTPQNPMDVGQATDMLQKLASNPPGANRRAAKPKQGIQ